MSPTVSGPRRRATRIALALSVAAAAACATACASSSSGAGASGGSAGLTTVSLALDWTPNTNHTGIFAAQELGYFKQQGIDLKILPYGATAPETLVSTGKADFGISYQDGLTEAVAAGGDLESVFAITQKTDVVIGVRADSGISSPKQLDGKVYAGYGSPMEVPMLTYVIKAAGGTGKFKDVTLNTDAYQALYAGQADFAMPEPSWEVIQAALVGKPLKTFEVTDYGFPAIYSAIIASSHKYLSAHADVARRFLTAVEEGYTYAAEHPAQAAALLIKANESVLGPQKQLVDESAALEASQYYRAPDGLIGVQSEARWKQLTDFLFDNGLLTDAAGKVLTQEPAVSQLYSNAYLPASVQSAYSASPDASAPASGSGSDSAASANPASPASSAP